MDPTPFVRECRTKQQQQHVQVSRTNLAPDKTHTQPQTHFVSFSLE